MRDISFTCFIGIKCNLKEKQVQSLDLDIRAFVCRQIITVAICKMVDDLSTQFYTSFTCTRAVLGHPAVACIINCTYNESNTSPATGTNDTSTS